MSPHDEKDVLPQANLHTMTATTKDGEDIGTPPSQRPGLDRSATAASSASEVVVDWDGPNDPKNPKKYVCSEQPYNNIVRLSSIVGLTVENGLLLW